MRHVQPPFPLGPKQFQPPNKPASMGYNGGGGPQFQGHQYNGLLASPGQLGAGMQFKTEQQHKHQSAGAAPLPSAQAFKAGFPSVPSLRPGTFVESGRVETYEVQHKLVALRDGPSIESKPVGRLELGNRVEGIVHYVSKEPWLRLSPQILPGPNEKSKNAREILPADEVWALIDASSTNLGLGKLLTKVAEEPGQDSSPWKVLVTKLAYRAEANLSANVLGYHQRGDVVHGRTVMSGGVAWLKSVNGDHSRDKVTWTLIDGSACGMGTLLKQVSEDKSSDSCSSGSNVPAPSAEAKSGVAKVSPKAKGKAKAQSTATAEPQAGAVKAKDGAKREVEPKTKMAEPKAASVEFKSKVKDPTTKVAEPKATAEELKAEAEEPQALVEEVKDKAEALKATVEEPRAAEERKTAIPSPGFKEGAKIRLIGLQSMPQLNGQEGTLKNWDAETERWAVSLHSIGDIVKLREKNLELFKDVNKAAAKAKAKGTAKAPEEKAKAKQAAAAKAKAAAAKATTVDINGLGDLSKWIYHECGKMGRYKILHTQVVIRNMPSVKAKMKGIVSCGDFIEGQCRDEWLLLDPDVASLDLLEGAGRWLLIDGSSVGFGMLMERVGNATERGKVFEQGNGSGIPESLPQPAKGPEERLPKVLCLHGAASGKSIFNWQASPLLKRGKKVIDFVVLEGPRACNDPEAVEIMSGFFKGATMNMYDENAFDERNWLTYKNPRSALKWLQEKLQEHAPVDGVLGFSQGADFAAMLAAQASSGSGIPLGCVVLMCPHAPGYAKYLDDIFKTEVNVPALIVRGEQEDYDEAMKKTLHGKIINKMGFKMASDHVSRLFKDPEILTHRDVHRILPEDKREAEQIAVRVLDFLVKNAKQPSKERKAAPVEFKEGASVRLVGLQSVPHLNKKEGTLQRWDEEAERWVVTLLNTSESVMLRERNIEIIKDECIKCFSTVGYKKDDDGNRYCIKCWSLVVCNDCKKTIGTELDDRGVPYCSKCWARRLCTKCTIELGEKVDEDGNKYCITCWRDVSCSLCRKALATKSCDSGEQFCRPCAKLKMCCRCENTLATKKDEDGHIFCEACWDLSSCVACRKRLGDLRDMNRNFYCSLCWEGLACVLCRKCVGTHQDGRGEKVCLLCWEQHVVCSRCKKEVGRVKEHGAQYCDECWYIHTLCVRCGAQPGEPRQKEGYVRFCSACYSVRERERQQEACRHQAQLFRDLLTVCQETAGPPMLTSRPGPPELPRSALPFLRRFKLGPQDGLPAPEAGLPPTPKPNPSPAQGTSTVSSSEGLCLEFTSAFDGGNATVDAWTFEPAEGSSAPTFATRVAPDFKTGTANLRAFDQARQYWFNFGVTPVDPAAAIGIRIRLKVGGMMRQEELFDNGYAPVCHSPSMPMWRRVDEGSVDYKREREGGENLNTTVLSWMHTFDAGDVGGTTYFAFCYPFSFSELQGCLTYLEHITAESMNAAHDSAEDPGQRLGCLHQIHAGCIYFPFGQHSLDPPRLGKGIYFHRQLFARSAQGRSIELLTVTEAPSDPAEAETWPRDDLPEAVQKALKGWPSAPPPIFPNRQICFASGRVHPGETPGQFAFLGLLQFLLSDDPRAKLLRRHFVFKLIPMMNPDGVSWGHSRTNSLGFDLNRCYAQPTPEDHDVVFAVRVQLTEWSSRGDICWYTDMHAHGKDRGCFLYGNLQPREEDFCSSVAYGHAVQMNCPHLDIDKCLWSTAPAPKVDQPDYDSGRGAMGRCCRLPLAYTLECNYNTGRLCRPVQDPPALAGHFCGTQTVREYGVPRDPAAGGRFSPVTYDPCCWAAVGEALAVAILDMLASNPYSRLLVGRPPKLIAEVGGRSSTERAHQSDVLAKLNEVWDRLTHQHKLAMEVGR